MSTFLTPEEMRDLTECRGHRKQMAWLIAQGYRFEVSSKGRPKVLRSDVEERLAGKSPVTGPRFPAEDEIPRHTYLFGEDLVGLFSVRTVEDACAFMDSMGVGYARLKDGRIYTTPWHLFLHYYPHWTEQAGPLYPFDGFEMSLEEIRKLPKESDHDSGVYFLFNNDELLYIGKSTQIMTRLEAHRKSGRCWSDQRILATAPVCAEDVEKYLIRQHLPPWNSRIC